LTKTLLRTVSASLPNRATATKSLMFQAFRTLN